ncbi:pimeloyl-ACP methyl ester carboxylesterase [Luteibacter sp. OK325]|uniref:alpha/beta fold hydrolase n=1 Tax=Luteibacter sp. OK325 TaxID=2135670 RepID=UPI000D490FAC|nr:alpha/beta hydrolase [Luteibacter sp. OK325]PTR34100.1 pimeloyl-ACP methyl ester carboxylesterase [Luteibacter sp. OK325]
MMKIVARTILLIAIMVTAAPVLAQPGQSGYAKVNGTELYYEIRGAGPPLVMLHGGVDPSQMFGAPLAAMAKNFKVIAIDARGHGHSKDTAAPWSIEQAADDVAAVLKQLKIDKSSVMGYSFGGAIALQFAIRHPDMLDKLVVVSAPYSSKGEYPEVRTAFEQMPASADAIGADIAKSPLAKMYPGVDWPTLMRKTGELGKQDFDWSAGIRGIKARTLLVFADADYIRPEHIAEFYKLLGGGRRDAGLDGSLRSPNQLAVVPGTTHYNLIASAAVTQYATDFLKH